MLSRELEETLRRAMSNAASRSHEFATLEHLLLALTDDDDAREVLTACNVDIAALLEKLNDYIDVELGSIVNHSDGLNRHSVVASVVRHSERPRDGVLTST